MTLFWDERGVFLEHYMPRGDTVDSAMYADLLKNHLRPAIKFKWRRLLSTRVLLQQSKICPSSVFHIRCTRQTSPPVTFMSLDRSKRRWEATLFRSDEEVQQVVHEWLCSQPKDFFSRGIHVLLKQWNTCMVCNGDYVEK